MRPLAVLIHVVGAIAALLYALTSISGSRGNERPSNIVGPAAPQEAATPRGSAELDEIVPPTTIEPRPTRVAATLDDIANNTRVAFGGGIEGLVVDKENMPVAAARVSLVNKRPGAFSDTIQLMHDQPPPKPTREMTTGADGSFRFANLDPNKAWTIIVTHDDYSRAEEGPIPVPENSTRRETIRLEAGLSCEGYVVDADTQVPIAGAKLVVDNPLAAFIPAARRNNTGRLETETDVEGRFVFKNVSRGQKTLLITAQGYATQVHNNFQMLILSDPDRRVRANRVQTKQWKSNNQVFELQRGMSIGGRVLAPDRSGVEDVKIEALSQTGAVGSRGEAISLAGGEFLIDGVAEGLYTLKVTAEGYQANPVPRIEAGSPDVEIVLAEQGSVRGKVLSPEGRPFAGAFTINVRAYHPGNPLPGAPVATKAFRSGGSFEVQGVPEGHYVVEALASQYASSMSDPFMVTQGIATDEIVVKMSLGGRLAGHIVDSYTGEPIAGAQVSTHDNNWMDNDIFELFGSLSSSSLSKQETTTDSDGNFEFKLMTPGEYQVQVKAKEFTTLTMNDVTVRVNERTEIGTKALVKGAVVWGIVYNDAGNIEPGSMVQLSPMDNSKLWAGQKTRTDADGKFRLKNVQAGTYRLYAQRQAKPASSPWDGVADMRNSETRITIADGGEYQYDLNLGRK